MPHRDDLIERVSDDRRHRVDDRHDERGTRLAVRWALSKTVRACRNVCRQEGSRPFIRRRVRRASRAVVTTVAVITTAHRAMTDSRTSATEDSVMGGTNKNAGPPLIADVPHYMDTLLRHVPHSFGNLAVP